MKIIYRRRGCGKTTQIVGECIANDGFLIVHHFAESKRLVSLYPGLRNRVLTTADLLDGKLAGIHAPIYIDNLDICLNQLFGAFNEIKAITLTQD